jgi:hypothetical protein
MKRDIVLPTMRVRTLLLMGLPLLVVVLDLMVWITAATKSGFWADDFLYLTHFSGTLGSLSNDQINVGEYVLNIFWGVGTTAFGTGSVLPFLMVDGLVFSSGLVVWLIAGTGNRWRAVDAWWIAGLFIATSAWLPTTLWASNITHATGFLALGVGLLAHERSMNAQTLRRTAYWALVSGSTWTVAIAGNPLYAGLMPLAIYFTYSQVVRMRSLTENRTAVNAAVIAWSLVVPTAYFAFIGYPAKTASAPYAHNGLGFFHQNLDYYKSELAPTTALTAFYVALVVVSIVGSIVAARRKDWFPTAVLLAAGATAVPALVQSQQRFIHYFAMPLLLTFTAAVVALRPLLSSRSKQLLPLKWVAFIAAAIMLFLTFKQGSGVRTYFIDTPYGESLASFRSQVASLSPGGGPICAHLALDSSQEQLFIAEMSGEAGFVVPPIGASHVYLLPPGTACPIGASATQITVHLNPRANPVASG